MAAPTLQAEGNINSATSGTLNHTLAGPPASNDIIILVGIFWGPNTAGTLAVVPTPTTHAYTRIADVQLGDDGVISWFWRRSTGVETTVTFTRGAGWDTGTDTVYAGNSYIIRGCATSGDPWDEADPTGAYTTANQAVDALTVSGSERLAVQFLAATCDWATDPTISGWTAGTVKESTTGTDAGTRSFRKDNIASSTSADAATIAAPDAGGVAGDGFYAFLGISFKATSFATVTGAVALSGTGSSTISGVRTKLGVASLSGTGSSTISATRNRFAAAPLSGTGSSTISGFATRRAVAALSGVGSSTIAGVRTKLGVAALSGTGSMTVAGVRSKIGAAALAGLGSLSASALRNRFAAAALAGTGSSTISGVRTKLGIVPLSGTGTFTASATRNRFATAPLSGAGALIAAAIRTKLGSVNLAGTGSSSTSALRTRFAAVPLSGAGTLVADGDVAGNPIGAVDLTGAGTLTASGVRARFGVTNLSGVGALVLAGVRTRFGLAALTGTGTLTADGEVEGGATEVTGAVSLAGLGSLSATATRAKVGAVVLQGTGMLTSSALRARIAVAHLAGTGALLATGSVDLMAAASLSAEGVLFVDFRRVQSRERNARPRKNYLTWLEFGP